MAGLVGRIWDPRLTARGVVVIEARPQPGEVFWKCVEGRYLDEQEAQGKHHIFIEVLGESGQRLPGVQVVFFNGGEAMKTSELKPGSDWAVDIPMYAAGYAYGVKVLPLSDTITRMGLGTIAQPFQGIHVAYRFVFRRMQAATGPTPPAPPIEPPDDLLAGLYDLRARVDALIDKAGGV